MISITSKGDYRKAEKFLDRLNKGLDLDCLNKYGEMGVTALADATPKRSGKTASSWYYEINKEPDGAVIQFNNSNVNKGVNIAVILQYGHGTGTGGYVEGIDYINPACRPIFDQIARDAFKELLGE